MPSWRSREFSCSLLTTRYCSGQSYMSHRVLLLSWLLPRLTVAQLQSISLITPPGAVMLGWLIGGETFPVWSLLGAAFVLVGVWMIFRKAKEQEPGIPEG